MSRFDSGATRVRLWLIRETQKARLYSKVPICTERDCEQSDQIWVPLSIVEHTTKRGIEHEVKLPDWFIQKEGL
jgi:hypothetical protein